MVTVVRRAPVSAQAVGSAMFNLAWNRAHGFQPAQSWPGGSRRRQGRGRAEDTLTLESTSCAEITGAACMFSQIRAWCWIGPMWHGWNGPKKTVQGWVCTHTCVFSASQEVSFCCPKVLMLAVGVALSGAVLWILWKAIMEEGRASIKSIVRLFCTAIFTSPSPPRFLPNSWRPRELLLSLPANGAWTLGPCSGFSTRGLADDGAGVRIYTGALYVSINESWPVGDHRETPMAVGTACPWGAGWRWHLQLPLVVAECQRWTGLAGLAKHALFCLALQFFSKSSNNPF